MGVKVVLGWSDFLQDGDDGLLQHGVQRAPRQAAAEAAGYDFLRRGAHLLPQARDEGQRDGG